MTYLLDILLALISCERTQGRDLHGEPLVVCTDSSGVAVLLGSLRWPMPDDKQKR